MKSIHIIEETMPMAWERAVVACWEQGESFPTQYDKSSDPNSRDVVAMIHVREPLAEPRVHRAFPGGLADLEKYRAEVLLGVHDHWIDPAAGKWEYTYHQRLYEYELPVGRGDTARYNQIDRCVEMLKACGYTRRAQAVTWKVWEDLGIADPACLQRMWFRVQDGRLNMVVHMRSNDAFKAAFMNMYAFVELQKLVADRVGVEAGEYCHIVDSFHIYGSYFDEFESFLKLVNTRTPQDRVWDWAYGIEMYMEGCDALLAENDMPAHKRELVAARRKELEAAR